MKLLKKLTVALLIACSFMLVVPVVSPILTNNYTVEAASKTSKPKMSVKVTKAKKSGDYYILEGKVYNKTKKKLDSASITIKLYDKKNKKIKTTGDSIMWMDAKGTWKFSEKIYVGNKKVKKYKVSASGSYFYTYGYTKLKASISKVKKTTSYGYDTLKVSGKIKNNTGKKLKSVYVTYAFYDKSGNILSTRFCGYYKGYKNGKTFNVSEKSFSMDKSLKAKKCRIVEVQGYTI